MLVLHCDLCDIEFDGVVFDTDEPITLEGEAHRIVAAARMEGWATYPHMDVCPQCVAEQGTGFGILVE